MLDYWDDSARHADKKWKHLWDSVIPRAQGYIARILRLDAPDQVVFAPNTHEFVTRLFSCFEAERPIRVLTTGSEFHSFQRQARRLEEAGRIVLTRVSTLPIEDFVDRFIHEVRSARYDFIFLSHVFFDSGFAVDDISTLVQNLPEEPVIAIDGYHAFCAIPVDLSTIQRRIFYLAGGYKYAQSGEGACFMHVPGGCSLRPTNTGWFASFGELESEQSEAVHYRDDGLRFAGATFDPSGLYRFNAVMDLFEREGITVATIHDHVMRLQARFIEQIRAMSHPLLGVENLLYRANTLHGHFLTFVLPSVEATAGFTERLASANIVVDSRGNRLRFGFGLYHDEGDIVELARRMAELR